MTDGAMVPPTDLPLPWQFELAGFESVVFTSGDREHQAPIVMRALSTLRATVPGSTDQDEALSWLLQSAGASSVQEVPCVRDKDVCQVRVPAGVYFGIVLGAHHASRIRSGIIAQPGQTTDLGVLPFGPTRSISFRVIDARTNAAIPGATATWDPPKAANAEMARTLYARLWTGSTDAKGRVTFPSLGPLPIPVRWRITAPGFATQTTPVVAVRDGRSSAVSDVRLQTEAVLSVRINTPRHAALPHGSLFLQEPIPDNASRFHTVKVAALRAGETIFKDVDYGDHRILLATTAGRKLCYKDFTVAQQQSLIDVTVEPLTIHGTVHRGGETVSDAQVYLFDPADASLMLAQAVTDSAGEYTLSTFQRGSLYVTTLDTSGSGRSSAGAQRTIDAGVADRDITVDFDVPMGGLSVQIFDLESGEPIAHALVDHRIANANGDRLMMGRAQTDDSGRLVLSGRPQGTADLHVEARGYRSRDITVPVPGDAQPYVRVDLQQAGGIDGTLVDSDGHPVPQARVSAGYRNEFETQPYLETTSNDQGRFHFDSPPEIGTMFYATAPAHGLGTGVLHAGNDNVITLPFPTSTPVYVVGGAGPLTLNYRITAAPAGGMMIPMGVLNDLAEAQGMTPRQLAGTAKDGTVLLPGFLGAGSYELFAVRRAGQAFVYDRIGTVNVPSGGKQVLVYHEAH